MWYPAKYALLLVLIVSTSQTLIRAQGFDWEYSPRLPVYAATVYCGPIAEYLSVGNTTDIQVLEQVRLIEPAFVCVQYNKGVGRAFALGFRTEWWKKSTLSFSADLCFQSKTAEFSADSPIATLSDGNIFQTRYLLSTSFSSICVEAKCKLRIPDSHVWGGIGLSSSILLSMSSALHEKVLSPSGYTFPGTTEQDKLISNKDIAGVRSFVINPVLSIGYDLDMGKGCYAAPALTVHLPLMNYTSATSWKVWAVGLQFGLLFSTNTY